MSRRPKIDQPLGGRDVQEWIGSSPNAKVPNDVKDRVYARAGGVCYLIGLPIAGKPWDVEHVTPLSMGGEHRESNLRPALTEKHKEKTSEEARLRAKADRMRLKHLRLFPKSKRPLESRGFEPARGTRP